MARWIINATRQIGKKFGRLTVLSVVPEKKRGHSAVRCQCECGNEIECRLASLTEGNTTSCGCYKKERILASAIKHGHARQGKPSPEFCSWRSMLQRCRDKNMKCWPNYGGRGITVCERWLKFENFLADMGSRPSRDYQLDRIDNNGNYEPSNCRWATVKQNCRNRRSNKIIESNGTSRCIVEWSEELGIHQGMISKRIRRGLPMSEVLSVSKRVHKS